MKSSMVEVFVSIIVATYKPKYEKLRATLLSLLLQENIEFEIIVADDGSDDPMHDELQLLFKEYEFENFKLVRNIENAGTVKNFISGMEKAIGKYIKFISPGDILLGKYALRDWVIFTEQSNADMSFSDVIYYMRNANEIKNIKYYASPQVVSIYARKRKALIKDYYLLMNDTIHGASILCLRDLYYKYLKEAEGKVIYAEDCLCRVMIYDGISVSYFEQDAIMYEYGEGISTSASDLWKRKIHKDVLETDKMLLDRIKDKKYKRRLLRAIKYRDNRTIANKIMKYIGNLPLLYWIISTKNHKRYTNTVLSKDNACFIDDVFQNND